MKKNLQDERVNYYAAQLTEFQKHDDKGTAYRLETPIMTVGGRKTNKRRKSRRRKTIRSK